MAIVEVEELHRTFSNGDAVRHALAGVSFSVDEGEFVAVTGPSGSGKSTLLHLMPGLDTATSGDVRLAGKSITRSSSDERAHLRRWQVGVVFQAFNLIPVMSSEANVALPGLLAGVPRNAARTKAVELLRRFGLADRASAYPSRLSGGEQQRVALARALFHDPAVLLADEPTGALDSESADLVLGILRATADDGRAVVLVTHNESAARRADREIRLVDGQIVTPVAARRRATVR